MAHGKSLELKKFDEEHSLASRQDKLCVAPGCGLPWKAHLKKDGTRMKKYGPPHGVNGTLVKNGG